MNFIKRLVSVMIDNIVSASLFSFIYVVITYTIYGDFTIRDNGSGMFLIVVFSMIISFTSQYLFIRSKGGYVGFWIFGIVYKKKLSIKDTIYNILFSGFPWMSSVIIYIMLIYIAVNIDFNDLSSINYVGPYVALILSFIIFFYCMYIYAFYKLVFQSVNIMDEYLGQSPKPKKVKIG